MKHYARYFGIGIAAMLVILCVYAYVSSFSTNRTANAAETIAITGDKVKAAVVPVAEAPGADVYARAYRAAGLESTRSRSRRFARERRAQGATFRNIRRVMKELRNSGDLSPDIGIARQQVAFVLLEEYPQAFMNADEAVKRFTKGFRTADGEELGFDWDSFLEFVQQIMEMIMKWMALFSDTSVVHPGWAYAPPLHILNN